jgi:hypothetical protein
MIDINYSLALDILLVILLLATIIYAMILSRRLSMFRANKGELETFLDRMNGAIAKAEASLQGMRATAQQTQATIGEPLQRAQALRDELVFLIQRADSVAEKLANGSGASSSAASSASSARAEAPAPRRKKATSGGDTFQDSPAPRRPVPVEEDLIADPAEARSKAERDLIRALRDAD